MLTAESEGGQLKCHPYWTAQEYGQFKVKALSEKKVSLDPRKRRHSSNRTDQFGRRRANTAIEQPPSLTPNDHPFVVVRKIALSHSTEPFAPMREITQLHYSSWPDFGAPAQPSHLISLVELSNSLQRGSLPPAVTSRARSEDPEPCQNSRPLLVHCSAGCGRTGTFCTVDSVIDMLKRQRKELRSGVTPMEISSTERGDGYVGKNEQTWPDNNDWIFDQSIDLVEKTVEDFRKQRISMVQSLRQYVLCYETILEWVIHQEHASRRERSGSESLADDRRSL
jgi:protein tyrosine phosphatase